MRYISNSIEDTKAAASKLLNFLKINSKHNVIGLSGDLGSGKTSFVKCFAELLGIKDNVTSPTYVIQKRYPLSLDDFSFKTLIHIDAYRLESKKDLDVLRFPEECANQTNLILIEWPEKASGSLPPGSPIIQFSFVSENVREIEFPDIMTT